MTYFAPTRGTSPRKPRIWFRFLDLRVGPCGAQAPLKPQPDPRFPTKCHKGKIAIFKCCEMLYCRDLTTGKQSPPSCNVLLAAPKLYQVSKFVVKAQCVPTLQSWTGTCVVLCAVVKIDDRLVLPCKRLCHATKVFFIASSWLQAQDLRGMEKVLCETMTQPFRCNNELVLPLLVRSFNEALVNGVRTEQKR